MHLDTISQRNMIKKQVYILVEGTRDLEVWKMLLREPTGVDVDYAVAHGVMSIISVANTMLEIKTNIGMLIIADADDQFNKEEKRLREEMFKRYIHANLNGNSVKSFFLSPNVEGAVLNIKQTDKEWVNNRLRAIDIRNYIVQNEDELKKNKNVIAIQKWLDKFENN